MSKISKELLRDYVNEQKFSSPDDILNAMKEMFRDVLQEVLEAEMDAHLGYDKNDLQRTEEMDTQIKLLSLNWDLLKLMSLGIEMANLNLRLFLNTKEILMELKKRLLHFMLLV